MKKIIAPIMILSLTSCFSYKPILDQNEKFFQTDEVERRKIIDRCTTDANIYLKQYKAERALKETGRKAIIGAVVGAGVGAIFGNGVKSIVKSAAVGSAVGAAAGGLGVLGEDKVKPDQIKQRYIANCLGKEGYNVIGWI